MSTSIFHTAPTTREPVAGFTEHLWSCTTDIRGAIDDLEFIRRLGDGTLPLAAFRTYIEQDAIYLAGYSKALSLLAARSPDPATAAFWAKSATEAVAVEMSLHQGLLDGGSLPPTSGDGTASPTCLAYVSYLIASAATDPYPVAAAAVLPCYWIYADVGRGLASSARTVLTENPAHPYAQWVTAYDSEEFAATAAQARALVDDAGRDATASQRTAMERAFVTASRYELMFWDTALHPTEWPLGTGDTE